MCDHSAMLCYNYCTGVQLSSLVNPHLSDMQRVSKLSSYWKFIILRNPLERIVSAFRNKLEAPLNFHEMYSHTFEMMKRSILQHYHKNRFNQWRASNGTSGELKLEFPTYIQWVVDTPNEKLNEHFCPMLYLSEPCRLHYDFYGNFKRISQDVNLVLEMYQIPKEYFHDQSYYATSGVATSMLLEKYYSTVSADLKLALFQDFYVELDYYYHLFPEERESHIPLLGVNKLIY